MHRSGKIIFLVLFVSFQIFFSGQRAFAEQTAEVNAEDQEIVDNLELLSMLDLMEEDPDMVGNYENIASVDDNALNVQKEGGQNE